MYDLTYIDEHANSFAWAMFFECKVRAFQLSSISDKTIGRPTVGQVGILAMPFCFCLVRPLMASFTTYQE